MFVAVLAFLAGIIVASVAASQRETTATGAAGTLETFVGQGVEGASRENGNAGPATSLVGQAAAVAGGPSGQSGAGVQADASGPGAAGTAAGVRSGGTSRGVTNDVIKIGLAWADWGWTRAVNPLWDNGNQEQQAQAVLARWTREKLVPINGRRVEVVARRVSTLNSSDQRAACLELVQDQKVFAVVAPSAFGAGVECVAKEFNTPIIAEDESLPTEQAINSSRNLFSLPMSRERMLRNWVHWGVTNRYFAGKKLGLYYSRYPGLGDPDMIRSVLETELAKFGIRFAAIYSTSNGTGGPEDQVAVQRFRAAGVNLAMLVVSAFNSNNFLQFAQSQDYRPQYVDNDYIFDTQDHVGSSRPPEPYDGTLAMSARRTGDYSSGTVTETTKQCMTNYESYARTKIPYPSGIWVYNGQLCDVMEVLRRGLVAAGRELTPDSFIRGIETVKDLAGANHQRLTFGPGKHAGEEDWRTVQWHGACKCWKVFGDGVFRPLWVR